SVGVIASASAVLQVNYVTEISRSQQVRLDQTSLRNNRTLDREAGRKRIGRVQLHFTHKRVGKRRTTTRCEHPQTRPRRNAQRPLPSPQYSIETGKITSSPSKIPFKNSHPRILTSRREHILHIVVRRVQRIGSQFKRVRRLRVGDITDNV